MASPESIKPLACLCLLWLSLATFTGAQTAIKPETNATPQTALAAEPAAPLKEYREILQQERKLLEEQSEKYYARIDKLIDRTTYGLGLLVLVALALFWWVFGKTRKDLESAIRADLEKDIRDSLQKDLDRIQAEVAALRDSRRVCWAYNSDTTDVERYARRLQAAGLKQISLYKETSGKILNLSQFDLIILSYDGTERMQQKLKEVVNDLNAEPEKTPILIHTPTATLSDEEIKMLEQYQAYSLAKVALVFYDRALSLSRLGKIPE